MMDNKNLLNSTGLDNLCLFVKDELFSYKENSKGEKIYLKEQFAKKYEVVVKVPADIDHAILNKAQVLINSKLNDFPVENNLATTVFATLINGQDYLADKKLEVVNARIGKGLLLVYELNGIMPIKHDSIKIFKK